MGKKLSPTMAYLTAAWNGACTTGQDSWRRINNAMIDSLRTAISSGMRFDKQDFNLIREHFRPQYWMAPGSGGYEIIYANAVQEGNISAAQSFETWKGRKPFITYGVLNPKSEDEIRLAVGFQFGYFEDPQSVDIEKVTRMQPLVGGLTLRVTSFDDRKGILRAKVVGKKPARVLAITHHQLRASGKVMQKVLEKLRD